MESDAERQEGGGGSEGETRKRRIGEMGRRFDCKSGKSSVIIRAMRIDSE